MMGPSVASAVHEHAPPLLLLLTEACPHLSTLILGQAFPCAYSHKLQHASVGNLEAALEAVATLSRASDGSITSDELLAAAEREGIRSSRSSASSLLAGGGDGIAVISNGSRQVTLFKHGFIEYSAWLEVD
jgi:hypothetical protein